MRPGCYSKPLSEKMEYVAPERLRHRQQKITPWGEAPRGRYGRNQYWSRGQRTVQVRLKIRNGSATKKVPRRQASCRSSRKGARVGATRGLRPNSAGYGGGTSPVSGGHKIQPTRSRTYSCGPNFLVADTSATGGHHAAGLVPSVTANKRSTREPGSNPVVLFKKNSYFASGGVKPLG